MEEEMGATCVRRPTRSAALGDAAAKQCDNATKTRVCAKCLIMELILQVDAFIAAPRGAAFSAGAAALRMRMRGAHHRRLLVTLRLLCTVSHAAHWNATGPTGAGGGAPGWESGTLQV